MSNLTDSFENDLAEMARGQGRAEIPVQAKAAGAWGEVGNHSGSALNGEDLRHRQACEVLGRMSGYEDGVAVLRAIEADQAETEEMRVAARDALRR